MIRFTRVVAALLLAATPAVAQDADLAPVPADEANYGTAAPAPVPAPAVPTQAAPVAPAEPQSARAAAVAEAGATYGEDDVMAAAEGAFGKGAAGAAKIIEKVFADLGRPNGYIVGKEASGAFIAGLRYGNGTLHHKIEGERPVHWAGPSVGFDVGGDANKTFTLVYNLNDTEELFRRYPQVEGKAYLIGGFTANYLQRDDVIIVPIKLGVGWRLGANLGYVNYTKKGRILPL